MTKPEDSLARARRLAGAGYASPEAVLELCREVEDLRQKLDPVSARGVTDDDIRSMLAEGFHTAWRKAVDSPEAVVIHRLIKDMDNEEWGAVIDFVANPLIRWLRESEKEVPAS